LFEVSVSNEGFSHHIVASGNYTPEMTFRQDIAAICEMFATCHVVLTFHLLCGMKESGMVQMNMILFCAYQANSVRQDSRFLNHALSKNSLKVLPEQNPRYYSILTFFASCM